MASDGIVTTFVIPAFNVGRYIEETLREILSDDRKDIEIVVVDDGSTDNTSQVVETIGDVRVRYFRQANQGVSRARNEGAANSRGRFIVFLDGDDLFDMSALDDLLRPLLDDSNVVATYGTMAVFFDGQSRGLPRNPLRQLSQRPSGDILRALLQDNVIRGIGTCCMRRASFLDAGGFNEGLHLAEDWDLFCRLACLGAVIHVPGAGALRYRQHRSSASARLSTDLTHYEEFATALFSEPSIVARFRADELGRLRRSNLASYLTFVAMKAVQAGDTGTSVAMFLRALRASPLRLPDLTARYGWTLVQHYIFGGSRA